MIPQATTESLRARRYGGNTDRLCRGAMMLRLILDSQALCRLKGGLERAPVQQQHIHYAHPNHDRRFVSDETEAMLREMMRGAGIADIWITSTVRDEHEQAAVMLKNLQAEN